MTDIQIDAAGWVVFSGLLSYMAWSFTISAWKACRKFRKMKKAKEEAKEKMSEKEVRESGLAVIVLLVGFPLAAWVLSIFVESVLLLIRGTA